MQQPDNGCTQDTCTNVNKASHGCSTCRGCESVSDRESRSVEAVGCKREPAPAVAGGAVAELLSLTE